MGAESIDGAYTAIISPPVGEVIPLKVMGASPPGAMVEGEAVRVAAEEGEAKVKKKKREKKRRLHEGSFVFC